MTTRTVPTDLSAVVGIERVFHDGVGEVRITTAPGDYIFVPPYVPHREENRDPVHPAVIVIARSTQEAIVVNLPDLYAVSDQSDGGDG
jgi:uncharacterized RmlC-like cupin family protein